MKGLVDSWLSRAKWICRIALSFVNYMFHILIAFLNPTDSLGEDYGCINLFQGIAILPQTLLNIGINVSSLELLSLNLKRIHVAWRVIRGFEVSVTTNTPHLKFRVKSRSNIGVPSKELNTQQQNLDLPSNLKYFLDRIPPIFMPQIMVQLGGFWIEVEEYSICIRADDLILAIDPASKQARLICKGLSLSLIENSNFTLLAIPNFECKSGISTSNVASILTIVVDSVTISNQPDAISALASLIFDVIQSNNGFVDVKNLRREQSLRLNGLTDRFADIVGATFEPLDYTSADLSEYDSLFYFPAVDRSDHSAAGRESALTSFIKSLSVDFKLTIGVLNLNFYGVSQNEILSLDNLSVAMQASPCNELGMRSISTTANIEAIRSSVKLPSVEQNPLRQNFFSLNYGTSPVGSTQDRTQSLLCSLKPFEIPLSVEALAGLTLVGAVLSKVLSLRRNSRPTDPLPTYKAETSTKWGVFNIHAEDITLNIVHSSPVHLQLQSISSMNYITIVIRDANFSKLALEGSDGLQTEITAKRAFVSLQNNIHSSTIVEMDRCSIILEDSAPVSIGLATNWNDFLTINEQVQSNYSSKLGNFRSYSVERIDAILSDKDAIILGAIIGSYSGAKERFCDRLDLQYLLVTLPVNKNETIIKTFHAGPKLMKKTTFDIKLINVSANVYKDSSNSRKFTYSILDNYRVYGDLLSLDTLFSHLQVFGEGNLCISLQDEFGKTHALLSEDRPIGSLFKIQKSGSSKYGNKKRPLLAIKSLPSEVHWSLEKCLGVGIVSSYSTFLLDNIIATFDFIHFEPLFKMFNGFIIGKAECAVSYHNESLESEKVEYGSYAYDLPSFQFVAPTSITEIMSNNLKLVVQHKLLPVLLLRTKKLTVDLIQFGATVNQTTISSESLYLFELSANYAVHRCLIGEYAIGKDKKSGDNSYKANSIDLHITKSSASSFSLMEVQVRHLKVFYIHRSVMTILSLINDHLIPSVRSSFALPVHLQKLHGNRNGQCPVSEKGMFRLGLCLLQSEVHLPVSSCGADAIVLVFDRCNIYKSCPIIKAVNPIYCQGPLLTKNLWISEMSNAKSVISSLFAAERQQLSVRWILPQIHTIEMQTPSNVDSTGASVLTLEITVHNATICTWCSRNAVAEGMTVDVHYELRPIHDPDNPSLIRNTVVVAVSADEANWFMTQGQYVSIVNLIQQNFCELQEVVEDMYVMPTPTTVNLTESLYGKNCMDVTLPLLSTVPIKIKRGRIVVLNNLPDYYELVASNPAKLVDINTYWLMDNEDEWDTVPATSCHYLFQDVVLNRKVQTIKEAADLFQQTLKETCGEPILYINFEDLFVDFFRKHSAGGNGIEVYAENFVLISAERAKSDMFSKTIPEISRLPTDALVFAPRSLPSLSSKKKNARMTVDTDNSEVLNKSLDLKEKYRDEEEDVPRPHIRYTQQGIANLRRCVVEISNSVAVAHMATILSTVSFFFDPIQQISEKNLAMLERLGRGPFDFKAALDVEVHVIDCLTCLPNCSSADSVNGLCAALNLTYTHAWRGFPICGPAQITVSVESDVRHIFVAPLHELYNNQIQPLVDRFLISYSMEHFILPSDANRDRHMELLTPSVDLSTLASKQNRKSDVPNGTQLINISLQPFVSSDDLGVGGKDPFLHDYGSNDEAENPCQKLRFSLKDVHFITAVIEQMNGNIARGVSTLVAAKKLIKKWNKERLSTFWDIAHLPLLTFYLIHVPNTQKSDVDREIQVALCDLEAILRNNTYNLDILRLNIYDIRASYTEFAGTLNMAAGLSCSIWAFNERHETWEPVVEPILMNAIGATDASKSYQTTAEPVGPIRLINPASTLQIRVLTENLDLNMSQLTVVDLVDKLLLPDVITTSSIFLPPYKVVNMLGQDVSFNIGMDGWMVTRNEIGAGKVLPIEVHQLTEALENFKRKKKYGSFLKSEQRSSSIGQQQYLIEISFKNLKDRYQSKTPVPIDKEGIFPFHMQLVEDCSKSIPSLTAPDSAEPIAEVSSQPIKFLQEVPLTVLDMRIKEDGVREILLRSIFAIRNHTKRAFQLSLKLFGSSTEYLLLPGREWFIPVRYANPKASLFFRLDDDSEWCEALSSLQALIAQGQWGAPNKLRAELSACSCSNSSIKIISPIKKVTEQSTDTELPIVPNAIDAGILVLLKPEARYPPKSGSNETDNFVSLRFPTKEIHKPASISSVIPNDKMDTYDSSAPTTTTFRPRVVERAQPLYLHLLPPIQLLNLLPQSILYRIADGDEDVISEGILLPGELVDIHNLLKIFNTRVFISIRMLNFCWSKWTQLLGKSSPFSTAEKSQDISLNSMDFYGGPGKSTFNIPALDITMLVKENVVKFTCPLIISNCTGLQLELCEPSNHESFISHCSQTRIETLIPIHHSEKEAKKAQKTTSLTKDIFTRDSEYSDRESEKSDNVGDVSSLALNGDGVESNPVLNNLVGKDIEQGRRLTKKFITLIIHSPSDHLQSFEVRALEDWTLHDVFREVKPKLALSPDNQQASKYLFFPWKEESKMIKRKIGHSITDDIDVASTGQQIEPETSQTSSVTQASPPDALTERKGRTQESRWSILRSSVLQKDVIEIPLTMQMDMLSDWSTPHCNMSTKVSDLKYYRLRLSHEDEWNIFKQVQSIKTETFEKDGLFSSIFSKKKHSFYCDYMQIVGDFPFRPHRMLGLSPLLAMRVADETDWSDTVDLLKSDFDCRENTITLTALSTPSYIQKSFHCVNSFYEFGVFVERGKGLLQNMTSVSIVPRHIILSNLSFPIEIRQIHRDGDCESKVIYPGSIQCFHYSRKAKKKLLQVRRFLDELEHEHEDDDFGPSTKDAAKWWGEVDISNLGFVFAKLRNPFLVIKVSVEIIGASWVATFSEQSTIWPPYRLENRTTFDIRYRQDVEVSSSSEYLFGGALANYNLSSTIGSTVISAPALTSLASKSTNKLSSAANASIDGDNGDLIASTPVDTILMDSSVKGDNSERTTLDLEWDVVAAKSTCSFAWDFPFSCNKILKMEVLVASQPTPIEIKLDEESNIVKLKVKTKPVILGSSLAEGDLMRYDSSLDVWTKVYCILMPDVLYIFQDESRTNLVDLVSLSSYVDNEMQFAIISRYEERSWAIMNSLHSSIRFLGSGTFEQSSLKKTSAVDKSKISYANTNRIRIMILRIAEQLGLFSNIELTAEEYDQAEKVISGEKQNSLKHLLRAKIGVEQLLEEASSCPVRVEEVVDALLGAELADDISKANEICAWLITENYLIPRGSRSRAFDSRAFESAGSQDDPSIADIHSVETYSDGEIAVNANNASTAITESGSQNVDSNIASASKNAKAIPIFNDVNILKSFEREYLYFHPPTLFPEITAQYSGEKNDRKATSKDSLFGFTIAIEGNNHSFKYATEDAINGWIYSCRQSVEQSWVNYELGLKAKGDYLSIEDFEEWISFRLRPDGPTKVLEISEVEAVSERQNDSWFTSSSNSSSVPPIGNLNGTLPEQSLKKTTKSSRKTISNLLRKEMMKSLNKEGDESAAVNHPLVFVTFSVPLVAISLMDFEPTELLYLSLRDIEMTVERSLDTVRFTGTVTEIQISNQLLRPEFPVALFPRRARKNNTGGPSEESNPSISILGFDPNKSFPSLHLNLQQKYHSDENSLAAFAQESNLHYFDVFSLWIAPFQLDVDEEFLVRCYRFYQAIRNVLNHSGSRSASHDTKKREVSFEEYLPPNVLMSFSAFVNCTRSPYMSYSTQSNRTTSIYFNLLQLHPIDLVVSFRPSQDLQITNFELAFISVISQLDTARLRLNALIAENAFGSSTMMSDILVKHYRASFWRQFHKLIGSADFVEGSVGLVANLGTGVYDLFYEPLEGLMDSNGSFLHGLSKGAASLSSRAIGGTSAFTSKLAGGLGKGVSLLTLDSQFQRNRTYRRYNKSTTVTEGLYVGTKELGKNIVEGVTGIVVSPYRGWETGGGVGFGMGVAKGILGVALKPAVGVFDLASRATEGIRNTAFSGNMEDAYMDDRFGIHRFRIPRAFGRQKVIQVYDEAAAAAQYLADMLTSFKVDPRLSVVHHMHLVRKVTRPAICNTLFLQDTFAESRKSLEPEETSTPVLEAWGYAVRNSYIVLLCPDRLVLAQILPQGGDVLFGKTASWATANGNGKKTLGVRFVWSCPAECIDQLFSDPWGDLTITINTPLCVSGQWNSAYPVVLDESAQDFVVFQSLLEQVIGSKLARLHPICPASGYTKGGIFKRYSSGFKSLIFMAPTKHTYRVYGNVLYEYSPRRSSQRAELLGSAAADADSTAKDAKVAPRDSEEFIHAKILELFQSPGNTLDPTELGYEQLAASSEMLNDNFLSFVYPLVDVTVSGPTPEDNGKQFCISMTRNDGQKMRVLRREEERDRLSEYYKISLQLLFSSVEEADFFKDLLLEHTVSDPEQTDFVPFAPLTVEERKRNTTRLSLMSIGRGPVDQPEASENSILSTLIIPTSGCDPEVTEKIKIEIGKTLSSIRR